MKEVNRVLKAGGYFCFIDIKPSIHRRILDFITFKLPISHPLKVRKNMLLEEKEMYDYFLMNHNRFMELFMKNFKIVWHKKGLCMDIIKALPQKSAR